MEPVLGDDGAILGVRVRCIEEACLEDERQRNQCVKSVCVWGGVVWIALSHGGSGKGLPWRLPPWGMQDNEDWREAGRVLLGKKA